MLMKTNVKKTQRETRTVLEKLKRYFSIISKITGTIYTHIMHLI